MSPKNLAPCLEAEGFQGSLVHWNAMGVLWANSRFNTSKMDGEALPQVE